MTLARDRLLQPSLGRTDSLRAAPYSSAAGFVAAFFGGPFAAVLMFAMNTQRLGRWRKSGVHVALGALLALLWLGLLPHLPTGQAAARAANELLGAGGWRYVDRLFALLLFMAGYGLHRDAQRTADLFGLPRPNGWVGGALALAGGVALGALLRWASAW